MTRIQFGLGAETSHSDSVFVSEFDAQLVAGFSRVPEVQAIYKEETGHVATYFVVVPEHDPSTYDALVDLADEFSTRADSEGRSFDFRVRASQGRTLDQAVPVASEPVYYR